MRILDLGCGSGRDLAFWGVTEADVVTGLDIDAPSLELARQRFPHRTYLLGAAERMPFGDQSFDRVLSLVALPYMDIPKTLAEIHRVLVPAGSLSATLHPPAFTVRELVHQALPKPIPTLFRLYVLVNGACFHVTGRTLGFVNGRVESFQTERGIRTAMNRAGFRVTFRRVLRPAGEIFVVKAEKTRKLMAGGTLSYEDSLNARAS
jgi:SAM-dependent methyltransferase